MSDKSKLTTTNGCPVADNQNVMTAEPRGRTILASVDDEVRKRHIRNCMKADPAYGEGVAKALGIALSELSK
jgi:catalase